MGTKDRVEIRGTDWLVVAMDKMAFSQTKGKETVERITVSSNVE